MSIDEFVDRCLKWNEGEGQLRGAVVKLLGSKGYMLRPICKIRSDAAGGGRPREWGPETQGELKTRLRGIDLDEQEGYISFALPFLISDICKLTGLASTRARKKSRLVEMG